MTTTVTTTPAAQLELPPGFITPDPATAAAPPQFAPVTSVPIPVAPLHIDAIRQHDGNPITHLSKSSFETFSACPEQFRRRYVLGQKSPTAPRMILGNIVDGALTWQAEQLIGGERAELGDLRRYFLASAVPAAYDREQHGIEWEAGVPEHEQRAELRRLGWKAVLAFTRDLAPLLGRAHSAQRKMEFRLAEGATWVVQGFLDLEVVTREVVAVNPENGDLIRYAGTPEPVALALDGHWIQTIDKKKPRGRDYLKANGIEYVMRERDVEEVVDYKVPNKAPTQSEANDDTQIATYLAGREIEGRSAERFRLAAMVKPTKTLGFRCRTIVSYRGAKQRKGVLARYANTARSINAFWREFGPDQPWQYADPKGNWRCGARFCSHWHACAGGQGL